MTAALTLGILLAYEVAILIMQRRDSSRLARAVHANLREEWFTALSQRPGTEILAVQTLRNSLMSATMTASTAALGLIGAVTLTTPSLNATFISNESLMTLLSGRTALELILIVILFASLVCSATAVRYYNHAGFICSMPVNSVERQRWGPTGVAYVRRAGLLYSWGLRHLLMVAPLLAFVVYPMAGPVAALIVVVALVAFDSFPAVGPQTPGPKSFKP